MTQTEMSGNASVASVHLVLQGKGGVGKSFVSAIPARPTSIFLWSKP
jgi:Mrp family chromosome partitioning ATPase